VFLKRLKTILVGWLAVKPKQSIVCLKILTEFSFVSWVLILPTTRTWRNRFVALSVPSTRLCSLRNHPHNLLLDLQTWPAKHTDGASNGRLHSDDQVRPQNHQMRKTSSVCEKLLLSFFSYISSISLWFYFMPLSVSGPNRILLCPSGMCQNPVMLFWDNVPLESVECGCLCVSARLCAWLRLFVPLAVRVHLYLGRALLRWWHVEACDSHLTLHVSLLEGL